MTITVDVEPVHATDARPDRGDAARLTFTTHRAALVDALAMVALAVPKRPVTPALGGVLLEVHGRDLTVSATDLDTTVSVALASTAAVPGRIVVDHAELTKLLGALVKGTCKRVADPLPVTIRANQDTAIVDLDGYSVPVRCYSFKYYPTSITTPPTVAQVNWGVFVSETTRVLTATSDDVTLPMFTAVNFDIAPESITVAATDRYRLAVAQMPATPGARAVHAQGALVSGPVLTGLIKRGRGDCVRIGVDEADHPDVVSFTCAGVTVATRTVQAEFPKYARLLPTKAAGSVQTGRRALLTATRRAMAVLDAKRERGGYLDVCVSESAVSVVPVLAEHVDHVSIPAHAAVATGSAEGAHYRFKGAYLADALDSFTGDTVTLHLEDGEVRPVLLTDDPGGISDPAAFRHLLMPVRLPDA